MKALLRVVMLVLVGLGVVLPLASEDGGGGDSGVWILPRSAYLGSSGGPTSGLVTAIPRATHRQDLARDVSMKLSSEMASPVAVLVDPATNLPIPLPASGHEVTIQAQILQSLASTGVVTTYGSVVDGQGRGYVLRLRFDTVHHSVTIDVF